MVYDDFQFLKFDRPDEGVLLITLNRPEVMNATNARLHWELTKIWDVVQNDPQTKVAIVTGAGDRAFSAGGDLAWERSPATEIAGLELQAPMLPIHTVAAGGGSVLRFDGRRLQVGPVTAGADPGTAAYR
jgi:enoyl-CoA hydratase/carnithine racemase